MDGVTRRGWQLVDGCSVVVKPAEWGCCSEVAEAIVACGGGHGAEAWTKVMVACSMAWGEWHGMHGLEEVEVEGLWWLGIV